jgi:hypothetical protein
MKEDLIECLTSVLFSCPDFSSLIVSLCREKTLKEEEAFIKRLQELQGIFPKHTGVSPYLTLDKNW